MAQNYFRLICLLTDIAPRVLRKFLEDQWQRAGYSSLIDLLNQEKHRFYHCLQPGRKYPHNACCCGRNKESYKSMTVAQWELLYQDTGASATCSYTGKHPCKNQVKASVKLEDLDITLLCFIIDKVFPGNTALGNIRKHRNEVIHSGTTSISDSEFQGLWFSSRSSILQIANTSAAPFPAEIQQEIDELEKRSMDPSECERLGKIVQHLTDTDNLLEGISEGMTALKRKTESIETIVLSKNPKLESIESTVESTATDTRSMKADVQTLYSRVESMETSIASIATDIKSIDRQKNAKPKTRRHSDIERRIENTGSELRSKRKGFYVSLGAIEEKAYNRLLTKHLVTISGRAGSGKTSLGKQLMIKYCDQHTEADGTPIYTPVIISKPEDFDKISSKDRLLVFIDDPFGASNIDDKVLKEWGKHFEKLLAYCNEGSIRVIIGVRSNLISEPEKIFRNIDLFSKENVLDLSSKQEITSKDKLQLLKSYCKEYKVQITGDEQPSKDSSPGANKTSGTESSPGANKTSGTDSSPGANKISGTEISSIPTIQMSVLRQISELDTFEGFPMACFRFFTSPSFFDQGTYFFTHAADILMEEISKLEKREPLLYFTLAFMLLEGGSVDLDNINEAKLSEMNDSEMNHGIGRKNRKVDIKDTCKSELSKVYIDKDHSTEHRNRGGKHHMRYKFTHQTVLEAVLMSLWDRYPEVGLQISCYDIIEDFVRPSGYNSMQNEICVNVPPGYDKLLAQKVVSNGCWLIPFYRGVSDASFVEDLLDVIETTEALYSWTGNTNPISLSEAINYLLQPIYDYLLHLKKAICTRYTHDGYEYVTPGTKQQTCESPCHPQNKKKLIKFYVFLRILNFFIENGEVDFVEQLMESHDIDPMSGYEYRDYSDRGCIIVPVCYAAERGYKHLLMFWMKKHVTIEKHDHLCLILDKCCRYEWTDILEQIIQNHRHGKHEKVLSPSSIYSNAFQVGRQMTKYFLQSNIDIALADKSGNTLFHHCSTYGFKTEVLMILKKHPEIVNVQNQHGQTAICLAAQYMESDIVKELLQHGADISIQDNGGHTFLHYCAVNDWDDIIQQFVTNTTLSKENKKGFSPGHIAVLCCNQKVVKTLIEAGVNLQHTKYSSVVLVVMGFLSNQCLSDFFDLYWCRSELPSEEKCINYLECFIRHNESVVTSLWEPLDDSHYTVIHYYILYALYHQVTGLLTHIISKYPRAIHARNKTRLPTAVHLAAYLGRYELFVLLYDAGVRITDGDLSIMDTIQLGRQNAHKFWDSTKGWLDHEGDCLLQKLDFRLIVWFGFAEGYEDIQKFYTNREHRR